MTLHQEMMVNQSIHNGLSVVSNDPQDSVFNNNINVGVLNLFCSAQEVGAIVSIRTLTITPLCLHNTCTSY